MFWQNFTQLCEKAGKSPNRVAADLGLSNSAATNWKRGATPRDGVLKQIADYFSVPVESLTAPPEAGESQLVMYYRKFSREGKGRLLDFAESMERSGKYAVDVNRFA